MNRCVLLFTILSLPVLGQTAVGTVQKIDKDQVQVKSRDGLLTFRVDEKSTVTKLKKFNDLSPLAVGDEIRVNYYGEGTLTAVNISAKVTVAGAIVEAGSNHLTVLLDSSVDAASTDRKVFVFLNPAAKLGTSRNQLAAGRRIHVIGWDAGDGVIDADKVAISETEPPLRPATQPRRH